MGIRCADHATTSTRKSLELTSLTSGGYSVGIVRLWTKILPFFVCLLVPATILTLYMGSETLCHLSHMACSARVD
jgi:hypothetical protein